MNIFNSTKSYQIGESLSFQIVKIRSEKKFNPEKYVDQKIKLLNGYMKKFGLKTCIVAVSGGIDSAIVLGIINKASRCKNSPIKRVIPVLLPALRSLGVTGQESATSRGEEVCNRFGFKPIVINIEPIVHSLKHLTECEYHSFGEKWAEGQLVPYVRTPTLYYLTSLSAQDKSPAIICGTTNKDEGAYLGYIGKASDGMVDVQIISDLHKSEVYRTAEYLDVPDSIIGVAPTGDMYDGRTDIEVFGASYSFVELYLNYLTFREKKKDKFKKSLDSEGKKLFKIFSENLEKLHQYNLHKYLAKSPAVHLDIFPNKVPGEWGVPGKFLQDVLKEINK